MAVNLDLLPQRRTPYLLNRDTGAVLKTSNFADGSLGQRLRAFVRFGQTGDYYGFLGQAVAAFAAFAACVLVYTGLALATRRFTVKFRQKRRTTPASRKSFAEQSVA